ncbi:MAG: cupredoxin domain-containing protein, partial [Ignavibacteria bacterium]
MKSKSFSQFKKSLLGFFIISFFSFYSSEVRGTTRVVNAFDFSFSPANITVTVGDTIKWQWLSGIHTTTSLTIPSGAAAWDAPLDNTNQTFIYRITAAGTYNYKCTPHFPGMSGNINAHPIGIIKQEGEV